LHGKETESQQELANEVSAKPALRSTMIDYQFEAFSRDFSSQICSRHTFQRKHLRRVHALFASGDYTQVGRVSGYVAMSHVVAGWRTSVWQAQQVVSASFTACAYRRLVESNRTKFCPRDCREEAESRELQP
jgi:hypothetical protein